jgi:transposase-like protein
VIIWGTFYRFPESHWRHLRTTNIVESPFAAVRIRTSAAKRVKRVEHATALIWKLLIVAEKKFRRLDAPQQLKDVFEGRKSPGPVYTLIDPSSPPDRFAT